MRRYALRTDLWVGVLVQCRALMSRALESILHDANDTCYKSPECFDSVLAPSRFAWGVWSTARRALEAADQHVGQPELSEKDLSGAPEPGSEQARRLELTVQLLRAALRDVSNLVEPQVYLPPFKDSDSEASTRIAVRILDVLRRARQRIADVAERGDAALETVDEHFEMAEAPQ